MTAEEQLKKLIASSKAYKEAAEQEIKELKALVGKLGRENEGLKPYTCNNLKCQNRKNVNVCHNCGHVINTNKK